MFTKLALFLYRRYGIDQDSGSIDSSRDCGTPSAKFVEITPMPFQDEYRISCHQHILSTSRVRAQVGARKQGDGFAIKCLPFALGISDVFYLRIPTGVHHPR